MNKNSNYIKFWTSFMLQLLSSKHASIMQAVDQWAAGTT